MEQHKRTIARAISYRVMALLVTAIWTGLSHAFIIHMVLTAIHYVHERAGMRLSWGRK